MKNILLLITFFTSVVSFGMNLHLVDRDLESGYSMYRTGLPTFNDIKQMCDLGITEMMVLSGNAEDHEFKYQKACPNLKVVYNKKQKVSIPLSDTFLADFDEWVKDSMEKGKKIAFRCNCGCHRTGRLAAYYQMKYQGLSVKDALALMKLRGKFMWAFTTVLPPQVIALNDYILGRKCSVSRKFCVRKTL